MTAHIEELIVPYTPAQMLNLVSDIETYPRFIKWVKALRKSRPRDEGDVHHCIGEAVVGFKGFTEQFATTVQTDRSAMTVKARLVRGPFRKLENDWHFGEFENNSTRITFRIDYQFSNPILSALASANKEVAVRKIMDAFVDEAARRYSSTNEQIDGSPPVEDAEPQSREKPPTG